MLQNVRNSLKPHICVFLEHSTQEILQIFTDFDVVWELKVFCENVVEELVLVARVVGRKSEEKFVEQSSQTIVVDLKAMSFPAYDQIYFSSISGAMYYALPQKEWVIPSFIILERP